MLIYGGLNSKNTKNEGKRKDKRGYVLVGRYHPSNKHGYTVYEHTLVMEEFLGRDLFPAEAVHHIDGNKSNNNINNLFLCCHETHRKAEAGAIQLIYDLYKKGVVKFDKEKGIYFMW